MSDLNAIQERLNGLSKGKVEVVPHLEKLEKGGGKEVKKGKHGGARAGGGRKSLPEDAKRMSIKQSWESFADEEVEVQQLDKGTQKIRMVKMKRLRRVQEATFRKAIEGDVGAQKEFNDRVGGKSPQPIRGEGENDAPIRIAGDISVILKKAYGNDTE